MEGAQSHRSDCKVCSPLHAEDPAKSTLAGWKEMFSFVDGLRPGRLEFGQYDILDFYFYLLTCQNQVTKLLIQEKATVWVKIHASTTKYTVNLQFARRISGRKLMDGYFT